MSQLPPEVYRLIDAALTEDQVFNDPTTQNSGAGLCPGRRDDTGQGPRGTGGVGRLHGRFPPR